MNNSLFLRLSAKDFQKGLIVAILGGVFLPVLAMLQTPGFDFSTLNWSAVATLAINGGIASMAGYLTKNLFSDSEGTFMGSAR